MYVIGHETVRNDCHVEAYGRVQYLIANIESEDAAREVLAAIRRAEREEIPL
jgi:hypothetical protein